ncbi:unnamed protein product [Prorocentrum cordatum]|uniref:Uncharacterized protein n=1 Tax=Prorocentrum cordatum TaxID=2364126 RepID=A0ABN9QJV6_9DINO|nr:unnamed protein product [Polarella glacialis]
MALFCLLDVICQLGALSVASRGDAGAQTGVACVMCERMLVDCRLLRRQLVCFSTAGAEVNGFAFGCHVLCALEALAHSVELQATAVLRGYNHAANRVAEGRGSWRTKSLMTMDEVIRSRVERGMLDVIYAETASMRADGLAEGKGPNRASKVGAHFGLWGHCVRAAPEHLALPRSSCGVCLAMRGAIGIVRGPMHVPARRIPMEERV